MGQIYRGAHLTIAVASGADGSSGCLNERTSRTDCRLQTAQENFNAELFASMEHQHLLPAQLAKGFHFPDFFQDYRLFSRKWCFQERMLSRRIVYYTAEELIWECAACVKCECGRPIPVVEGKSREEKVTSKRQFNDVCIGTSVDSPFEHYLALAREYAVRNVTRDDDVLPAFSAIARPFAAKDLGDYHAGLWSSKLLFMLCWRTTELNSAAYVAAQLRVLETVKSTFRRLSPFVIPSWSWMSAHAMIEFPARLYDPDPEQDAEVVNVSCETVDGDAFGRVRNARMHIRARAWNFTVARVEPRRSRIHWHDKREKSQTWWGTYTLDTQSDWESLPGQEVWVVQIRGRYRLLLLRCEDEVFRRVVIDTMDGEDGLIELVATSSQMIITTEKAPRRNFVIV